MTGGRVERRLAAILAADVSGYSRLMGADELGTLHALKTIRREIIDPALADRNGRIVKTTGDGVLVEFASAVDAVTCAMAVQDQLAERNGTVTPPITFRIGINIGDIIIDGDDIFGDGVNVAARVETECEPGGVFLSGAAYEQVRGKTGFIFDDVGERSLKNIDRPVRLYAARKASASGTLGKPVAPSEKFSMAVLPFQNLSSDPEQAYFAEGLTANLTTDLSRIAGLFVIASTTAATLGAKADVRLIGRDLGVRYALQGGVQKAGNRVRVNARMLDTSTSAQLWSDRFDGDQADLFELQDQIVSRIANSIGREIIRVAVSDIERRKIDPQAADYHIRGVAVADKPQTFDNMREQEQLFRQAVTLDPHNADAWARLARSLLLQRINYSGALSPEDLELKLTEGQQAVEKAIALDPNSARARLAEGLMYSMLRKPEESARANEAAIALDRNLSMAYSNLGVALINMGRPQESLQWIQKGIQLDPLGPQVGQMQFIMGKAYFLLTKTEAAIEWLERARASNPGIIRAHAFLALAYAQKGDDQLARNSLADVERTAPHFRLSTSSDAPGPFSSNAYRDYYERIILPAAEKANLPV